MDGSLSPKINSLVIYSYLGLQNESNKQINELK